MEAATKGEGKESVRSRLHGLPPSHLTHLGSVVPPSPRFARSEWNEGRSEPMASDRPSDRVTSGEQARCKRNDERMCEEIRKGPN